MIAYAELPQLAPVVEFGDYPYGTEPLELPSAQPSDPGVRPPGVHGGAYAKLLARTGQIGRTDPGSAEWQQPSSQTLHWFRWITGHQVTFLFWRALLVTLQRVATHGRPEQADAMLRHAVKLTDGYTAMLLYTGSCSPDLYNSLYRTFMALHHQAFSGKWSYEYRDMPRRFAQAMSRLKETGRDDLFVQLRDAYHRNHLVHASVAKRLVPDDVSLLQHAGTNHAAPTWQKEFYFDSFFLVRRGRVRSQQLRASLVKRMQVVLFDLMQNGLYTDAAADYSAARDINADAPKVIHLLESNLVKRINDATFAAFPNLS